MRRLNPDKLHATFLSGTAPDKLVLPRRYTLTHSDRTGELFLTIGSEYDTKEISRIYVRLMRDEVLAELSGEDSLLLNVFCHVSGGFVLGTAKWRYNILQHELPLALEAIRYGDKTLFEQNPDLDDAPVLIRFKSSKRKYDNVENWGVLGDYR
jgi:hypothetical protein